MAICDGQLDLTFGALSDATRRGMLQRLSQGEANVSTLARPYKMSQPAISKHLRVLERAGLIEREKRGREQIVRIKAEAAEQAADWISFYLAFWKRQFDGVEACLERKRAKKE